MRRINNSLDYDPNCETMVPMTCINEKVFAWNYDNYYEFGSAIGSTNLLQDNKSLSLGMPMHPQEEESDEEKEEDMIPPKLGDMWELPLSPPIYDSNPKTQNSLVFYGACYYDECDDDMSIINFEVPNNDFNNNEYVLNMQYDDSLDDGPTLLNDSLYVYINSKLHSPAENMHGHTNDCCNSFIYKMQMHRKKVRIRYYLIYVSWYVLSCFIFAGLITSWDPGILSSSSLSITEKERIMYPY